MNEHKKTDYGHADRLPLQQFDLRGRLETKEIKWL